MKFRSQMYSRQKKIIRLGTKASWQVLNLFRPVLGLVLITQLVWGFGHLELLTSANLTATLKFVIF